MKIDDISLFIEVYVAKSFAKVAKVRDISPSIVSRAIAGLEEEIGVALFHRTTRKIMPTDAGIVFYSRVSKVTADLAEAVTSAQNLKRTPSGILRITAPVSFGVLFLPGMVQEFRKIYPELEIDLVITDTVVDIVEHRIDLAFRFGHLPDSSFVAKKLVSLDYVVCASPSFLRTHPKIRSPEDVSKIPCVQFLLSGFNDGWKFKDRKNRIRLVLPGKGIRASNALVIKEFALNGSGLALLPKVLISEELRTKKLVNLFPDFSVTATEFDAKVWMLYPRREHLPEKTRLFIDFAGKYFEKVRP